jgi:hypothetical protein
VLDPRRVVERGEQERVRGEKRTTAHFRINNWELTRRVRLKIALVSLAGREKVGTTKEEKKKENFQDFSSRVASRKELPEPRIGTLARITPSGRGRIDRRAACG